MQAGSLQAVLALALTATLAFGPCHGDAAAAPAAQHSDSLGAAVSDTATTAKVKAPLAEDAASSVSGVKSVDTNELRLASSQ